MARTPLHAALLGALGFGAASVAVFATVAFAERWMYKTLGLGGAYAVWTALFVGLGGGALLPLVPKAWRGPKFLGVFAVGFVLYAAAWCAAYFGLRGGWMGEILGGLAGGFALGQTLAWFLKCRRASLWIVPANLAGYFVGSALNNAIGGRPGMLLWGVAYGLLLGAGLGLALRESEA